MDIAESDPTRRTPGQYARETVTRLRLRTLVALGVLASGTAGLAFQVLVPVLPLYVVQVGGSEADAGLVYAMTTIFALPLSRAIASRACSTKASRSFPAAWCRRGSTEAPTCCGNTPAR